MRVDMGNKIVFSADDLSMQNQQKTNKAADKTQENAALSGVQASKDAASTDTTLKDKQEQENLKALMEGELRSVSKDGDQLRVKDGVVSNTEDGVVRQKDQVTNLTGYSMDQVREMYYQGRVSRNDYDTFMGDKETKNEELGIGQKALTKEAQDKNKEKQEEKIASAKEERIKAQSQKMADEEKDENSMALSATQKKVETGRTDQAKDSEKLSRSEKEDKQVQSKEQDKKEERLESSREKSASIKQEEENDARFLQQMGNIAADKQRNDLENEALNTARTKSDDPKQIELMGSILGLN